MPYLFRRPLLTGVLFFMGILAVRRAAMGPPAPGGEDVSRFMGEPRLVLQGRIAAPPSASGRGTRYFIRVDSVRTGPFEPFLSARGGVTVWAAGRPADVDWGDLVLVWGRPAPLRRADGPGAYDESIPLADRGIHMRLTAGPGRLQALHRLGAGHPLWWVRQARRRLLRLFHKLDPPSRAVMAGLVLGEKPAGLPDLQESFRRSGTIHLLVASGTNVAFVLAAWWVLGRWLFFLPRRLVLAAGIPLSFFYAYLAAADPPVLRSAVMASVGIIGFLSGRVDRPLHAWGVAALVLTAMNPGVLAHAGFQMSFAAALGLVLGLPAWERGTDFVIDGTRLRAYPLLGKAFKAAAMLFGTSLLAQAALSPLLIHYFQRVTWVGLLANMAAVPWAGVCLLAGIGWMALEALPFSWPARVGFVLAQESARWLWKGAAWAATAPHPEIFVCWGPARVGALAAGLLFIFIAASFPPSAPGTRWFFRRRVWGLAGGFAVLAAVFLPGRPPAPPGWTVAVPRSRGEVAASLSPGGRLTLFNTGGPGEVRRLILPLMRSWGVREVHRLVLVSGDAREEDGAAFLSDQVPVREVSRRPSPGISWDDDGVSVDILPAGVALRGEGRAVFLSPSGPPAVIPPGEWDVVVWRPRGDLRRLDVASASLSPKVWVLWGRGGRAWASSPGRGPVHRLVRDGYFLF